MTNQEAITHAKEIIGKCMFSLLATVDGNGCPQMRAMMPVAVEDDLTVYYATGRNSAKCSHVATNPMASSLWSEIKEVISDWRSVLVKGKAQICDDKVIRNRFWNEEFNQYFPGGVDDPNYVILVIKPTEMILTTNETMPPLVVKL